MPLHGFLASGEPLWQLVDCSAVFADIFLMLLPIIDNYIIKMTILVSYIVINKCNNKSVLCMMILRARIYKLIKYFVTID